MASRDRHLEVDDIPPPPYSETDIYSNASPTTNTHPRRPSSADTDDASTTNGEVIYTPPLTPRSSSHNSQRNQGFASHLPSDDGFLSTAGGATPTDVTTRSNANSSPSLAAYFQSRHHSLPATQLVEWTIVVKDDGTTVPDDLPYPEEQGAEARGVMGEDWMTFLNYLLPDHLEQTNKRVVDRKLAAEGLSPSSPHEERDRSPAERQLLEAIRGGRPVGNDGETPQTRRERMENMVREWNDGFFEKRGITVRLEIKRGEPRGMPGAYPLSYEQPQPQQQPQPQPQQQSGQNRGGMFGRWSPGNMFGYGSGGNQQNGFNLGGIKVEGERVSIGNNFVADGRSGYLKIGGIVADSNGISINGWNPMHAGRGGRGSYRDMRGGCGDRRGGAFAPHGMGSWGGQDSSSAPGWHPPLWGGGRGWRGCDGGRGQSGHHYFGRGGRGSWLGSYFGQPPAPTEGQAEGQPQPQQGQDVEQGVMQPEQYRGRGREGRKHSHGRRHKSRSSSVSSASSSSSSSSESSVGSLPDYDDLKDTQLPIARQYLKDSLHHPEQQITREQVKQAKEQIRAARNANVNQTVNVVHDRAALRREFKELRREWKQLKKEQKKQRRQLRKERRQRRKEEKREHRNTRREMRRAEKDFRRNGRGPTHPHTDPVDCWQHPVESSTACFSPPPPPVPPSVPPFVQGPWSNGSNPNSVFMHPHMPPGMNPPGAWPTENNNHVQTPPEHRASTAIYKALDEMDAEIAAKEAELLKLHEEIAGTEQGASRGDGAAPYWPSAETEKAALHVEKEIEELALKMEKLRTEADEEFARELAREEEELARVS